MDINTSLISFFSSLGISQYFGVNGGGAIQFAKDLSIYSQDTSDPNYFYLSEYCAGFAPLGYYLTHKRPAACLITTGAAEKMVGVGISDAKFMNLPCLYLMPLSSQAASHHYPLQDVSSNGMNIVSQYKAELGEAVIVIDENCNLIKALSKIKRILDNHHPVVVFFRPEVLCRPPSIKIKRFIKSSKESEDTPIVDKKSIKILVRHLKKIKPHNRILVMCSTESSTDQIPTELVRDFVNKIDAQVIYSVNGDNSASATLERNLGHLMLGGNPMLSMLGITLIKMTRSFFLELTLENMY